MTFLDRYAAAWAARAGCRVFLPGEALPERPPPTRQEAADRLLKAGWTLLQPGEVALVSVERAKEVLHALGMTVLPPIHRPGFGPWVPKLAPDGAVLHPTRIVDGITSGGMVSYTEGGAMRECLLHFWAWRKRVAASLEGAAP